MTQSDISSELDEVLTALENNAFYEGTKKPYMSHDEVHQAIQKLITKANRDAYERGYQHGHRIGYNEGKSGYKPEQSASTDTESLQEDKKGV